MKEISVEDKAYFAGLFDGEGCVNITKDNKQISYELRVLFHITYASVLYEMESLFGGGVSIINMEKVKDYPSSINRIKYCNENIDNHKQSYTYSLCSKEAWVFLKIVYPYCREKKEQARIAIEFYNRKRDGRYGGLSDSERQRCEYYYKKLQEMKKQNMDIKENNSYIDNQQTFDFYKEV